MNPYHAFSLEYPESKPYDNEGFRWTTFLGEFVRRIAANRPDVLYWTTHYGHFVEFKVLTDDLSGIQNEIDQLQAIGFTVKDLQRTLEEDLGSPRFIGASSPSNKTQRANLILNSLKSVCDLMLDSIVKRSDGYWEHEPCGDKFQNPIGNHMFSVTHLYHLIASADVLVCPFITHDSRLHLLSYYYYELNKNVIGPHAVLPPQSVRI
jgi:hypothetical protein